MSTNSAIEWTDNSWQVTSGCTKVSAGCKNCYAETMANRLAAMATSDVEHGRKPIGKAPYLQVIQDGHWNNRVVCLPQNLEIPLHWNKPRRIFVDSMSDLFHKDVPFEFIDKVFAVMALCQQHTFQVLTKRPERMAEYLAGNWGNRICNVIAWWLEKEEILTGRILEDVRRRSGRGISSTDKWPTPLPNVWLGTSIENTAVARDRLASLAGCPAAIRFLSLEPLLGGIDLVEIWRQVVSEASRKQQICPAPRECSRDVSVATIRYAISWVIIGGESGGGARQCHIEWIEKIVEQCKSLNIPCFVKQLGKHPTFFDSAAGGTVYEFRVAPPDYPHKITDPKGGNPDEWPEPLRVRQMPEVRP